MIFNHGWTRINTDKFQRMISVFIRVHLCPSVVNLI